MSALLDTDRDLVDRYLELGLALGRHVEGLVDAYTGPPELAAAVAAGPVVTPARLADAARTLLADLEVDAGLSTGRRHWLAAQVRGLRTTAARLAGEPLAYVDEVEACYGVRPRMVPEEVLAEAHRRLDAVLPGDGDLALRYATWREAQAVPISCLDAAVASLAEDLRERTWRLFGLPDDEHVDFELVTGQPWAGFNYYLGELRSRVAINVDLPVLSPTLAHLVAHEAYPGHHTEHCRKEIGLVRRRRWLEETIFLVGTPQCLLAEGLADLGLEVVVSPHAEERAEMAASHLRPLGIPFDAEVVAQVATAGEGLQGVRGNVAMLLHGQGVDPHDAVAYAERWGLLPRPRAEKLVSFLTDSTWRAYITCYVEGLPLCRRFVAGDPARFERLLTEQLTPDQLMATAPVTAVGDPTGVGGGSGAASV
ncbi:MAG: DUF885 domain-containing protein [Actinobacteria bacterium]|nr:DUF885 domain-containing protein [Actinomycetota bacterium]